MDMRLTIIPDVYRSERDRLSRGGVARYRWEVDLVTDPLFFARRDTYA